MKLKPLRPAVKRQRCNGAKMIRKYGTAAIRAARRETGIVPGMHADDPAFYYRGFAPLASKAPRLVKKGG